MFHSWAPRCQYLFSYHFKLHSPKKCIYEKEVSWKNFHRLKKKHTFLKILYEIKYQEWKDISRTQYILVIKHRGLWVGLEAAWTLPGQRSSESGIWVLGQELLELRPFGGQKLQNSYNGLFLFLKLFHYSIFRSLCLYI